MLSSPVQVLEGGQRPFISGGQRGQRRRQHCVTLQPKRFLDITGSRVVHSLPYTEYCTLGSVLCY